MKKISPVKQRINDYLEQGLKPEQVAKKISKENNSSLSNATAFVTMVVKQRLIESLPPVKQAIAKGLDSGLTPKQVAEKISKKNKAPLSNTKAFVTMVVNLFKQKAINFKAIKTIKVVKKPIEVKPTILLEDDEYFGPGKQNMRQQVLRYLRETEQKFNITKGLVLTLSCVDCRMESLVNAIYCNYQFLAYECDKTYFTLLKRKIKTFGFNFMLPPINGYIIEAIKKAKKDTYAHLFLDFCKSLKIHSEDIKLALSKDIVKLNGIVWITVCARGGGINPKETLTNIINESGGGKYEILSIPNGYDGYRDTTPMVSMLIRRIK